MRDELLPPELIERAEKAVHADPRPPRDWSDGDKLRLLAMYYEVNWFDVQRFQRASIGTWLQDDLRRMADRLDIADLPEVDS